MSNLNFMINTSDLIKQKDYLGKPVLDDQGNQIGTITGVNEAFISEDDNDDNYVSLSASFLDGFKIDVQVQPVMGISVKETIHLQGIKFKWD